MVRHEKPKGSYWLLPGGGVEARESLPEALARELQEEACVGIETGEPLMIVDSIMPGGDRHIVNLMFRAVITSGAPKLGIDESVVEIRFVPLDELKSIRFYPDVATELLEVLGEAEGSLRYIRANWREL